MYLNYNNTVICLFCNVKPAPFNAFLAFKMLYDFVVHAHSYFIPVVNIKPSPHLFLLNSQIFNSILYRTPVPNLTKIG
jgi:hypothetical protein